MKPAPFEFHAPQALAEVIELLADDEHETRVIAGGQSLVPMMNFRLAVPEVLVGIKRVRELADLRVADDGSLHVGAAVTQAALLRDARVASGWPLLCAGVREIGHPQVRSRGTVCGSLAHHDPHGELPALAVALGATLVVAGPDGHREVQADDFFVSYYEVALDPGELLIEVRFPALPEHSGWSFREIARRRGDFALVGVACMLEDDGGSVVIFGAGERPVRVEVGDQAPAELAELVGAVVNPHDDLHASAEYRREAAGTLAADAVVEARERMRA